MSNYSPEDIHRSLARFVANALGSPPWRVRTQRETIADDQRPAAVIESASPSALVPGGWRSTVPQGDVQRQQSWSVMAYPVLGETGRESRAAAELVAKTLEDAVTVGLVAAPATPDPLPATPATPVFEPMPAGKWWPRPQETAPRPQSPLGGPLRLPVFDFDGVPVTGPGRGGPDVPYGYLWVEDASSRALQDPIDFLRWTAVLNLRVMWWQGGRVGDPGVPVKGIAIGSPWVR